MLWRSKVQPLRECVGVLFEVDDKGGSRILLIVTLFYSACETRVGPTSWLRGPLMGCKDGVGLGPGGPIGSPLFS